VRLVSNEDRHNSAPSLTGSAQDAVRYRDGHIQIIAAAGSGKTEVVAQRVVDLLAGGAVPESIVSFTFTERAATELKNRIDHRVAERLGTNALDRMTGLYIGTIHGFCLRLLHQHVPRYETYDVLDDNQLTALLSREATHLGIRQLDPKNRLFASIKSFLSSVDVVENELLNPGDMPDPFASVLGDYLETLDRYRFLTYGQQIVRAVHELMRPELAKAVHATLRHLIVDEYQDVNPAQERLIELLAGPEVQVCVVGDDDQAIYQWRGSDVSNIVTFPERYAPVATFEITTNRRSRPQIIEVANQFAQSISGRIEKTMYPDRPPQPDNGANVVAWSAPTEIEEAGWIANMILDLVERGTRYGDIAILVRSRVSYSKLLEQLATFDIPVQPGGRTGMFAQPEAQALGHTICWLSDLEWRTGPSQAVKITDDDLLTELLQTFGLDGGSRNQLGRFLQEWKIAVPKEDRTADLVGEFYELLGELGVQNWDTRDPITVNKLGTLARFSALLADYESVRRRSRPDATNSGEQVGGQDRGRWYYVNLGTHIINYAQGAYDDFDGEPDFALDAVDLMTIHRAKGLEWPVVFVPSLTKGRFPSRYTGKQQNWLLPRDMFAAARYEGSDTDERRLFYVAMTRARDWLSLSKHESVTKNASAASPYYGELSHLEVQAEEVRPVTIEGRKGAGDDPISITYSELAAFIECGHAFRLREQIGFQPRLAVELGYGKAVHHVMRTVAEETQATGHTPAPTRIDTILDENFFIPTANKVAHRQLKDAARRLIATYVSEHEADLYRIWETERPFELHLEGVTVTGRADVILDKEDGVPTALAIVDYKTATRDNTANYALQLQVYADAGRREGLDVRAAYVHDLKASSREPVRVDPAAISQAETAVVEAVERIWNRDYRANPGEQCRKCEVRTICISAHRS